MSANGRSPTIFFVAGDVSGDQNAAYLAEEIRRVAPHVRLLGAGGPAMRAAGVEIGIETTDLSAIGVFDSLWMIRRLIACYRRTQRLIRAAHPDLVVLVDSESVNVPAAIWLRRKGIPVAFFFPPQVWLWGRWRLRTIVPLARRFLSAFREEAELYSSAGADTVWVGHPLRDHVRIEQDPHAALRAIGLDPARPMVALMPGSRKSEIRALAPPILGAARVLQERQPSLQFALPLASESLRAEVQQHVQESGLQNVAVYHPRSYAVLSQAQVVLQSSGTATLEAALLGIPAVIAYRCHPIEYFVGRYLLIDAKFIGMPNILLGEMVQPEFFHKHVDAAHLAEEAWSLLTDQRRRQAVQARLATVRDLLGPPESFSRAADAVLDLLPRPGEATAPVAAATQRPAVADIVPTAPDALAQ